MDGFDDPSLAFDRRSLCEVHNTTEVETITGLRYGSSSFSFSRGCKTDRKLLEFVMDLYRTLPAHNLYR